MALKEQYIQCEIEVAEGLEQLAQDELMTLIGYRRLKSVRRVRAGVQFEYQGDLSQLLQLRCTISIYIRRHFDIPRPKALLGHANLQRLFRDAFLAMSVVGKSEFSTLHISAAGSNSSVMNRLKQELSQKLHLKTSGESGDLWIRIRRVDNGWDVLTRITPRPLSARSWRVCNMEGALNGPIAHVLARFTHPHLSDIFVNLACGSGSILIERAAQGDAKVIVGCDIQSDALECASRNVGASGYDGKIQLIQADICALPFPDQYANAICADLHFGQLVGSHQQNLLLYPQILQEAARISQKGALFALLTHEVRLMDKILPLTASHWELVNMLRVALRGLHPRIYVLRKR